MFWLPWPCLALSTGTLATIRPLTLEEQAAIAGGSKGRVCGRPVEGTMCNKETKLCVYNSCIGKAYLDDCGNEEDYANPRRCVKTLDESVCCSDGDSNAADVLCMIFSECSCDFQSEGGTVLSCYQDHFDYSYVKRCKSGPCDDKKSWQDAD